jgi:chromosome segregation ATPase
MTTRKPGNPADSLDPKTLLEELLRTQVKLDHALAEKDLLKERLVLATRPAETTPPPAATVSPLPDRLGGLADQLIGLARELRQFRPEPVVAAPDPEVVLAQRSEIRDLSGELEHARSQVEALETQIRYLEISGRDRESGGSSAGEELGRQLAAALEREDQLLIRLHQLETTLSHRQADQLTLLERDKQIQQLKYFLHQGALDFEKLQTRHRAVEAESLEQKHRIIDLQTQLERSQASSRSTVRRLQDQVTAQTTRIAEQERALRAAETRQENLEDEVERLQAQAFQMEEKLFAGAGQLELVRFEAGRVPSLENRVSELEDELQLKLEELAALRDELAELHEAMALLEENAGALDARVGEDAETIGQLHTQMAAVHEDKLVAAMELVDRKEEALKAESQKLREASEKLASTLSRVGELERLLAEAVNTGRDREREAEVLTRELTLKEKSAAELERRAKDATEAEQALRAELAQVTAKAQSGGDRQASELALQKERTAELENALATARIEVQRLAAQVKTAEMKTSEASHWTEKLKAELAAVQGRLDEEIRLRAGSEEKVRQVEGQLPEIRRLFDAIERQVDGFEDSLALEEDRTARLGETLDQLVSSIAEVFGRITDKVRFLESERGMLAGRLQSAEQAHATLAGGADSPQSEKSRQTIHDLNVQLGILEGNLLTMQVKMHNQLAPSVEKILRVTGDLELLGMLNAAAELRSIAGSLSGLMQ